MDNNEIEQLRKVISEEISKQLEPIINTLEEIKIEIKTLKKNDNNICEDVFDKENICLDNELKVKEYQEPIDKIKQILNNRHDMYKRLGEL